MSELNHLFDAVDACLEGRRLDPYEDLGRLIIAGRLDLRKLLMILKSGDIEILDIGGNIDDRLVVIDCVYCENERLRTENRRLKARLARLMNE